MILNFAESKLEFAGVKGKWEAEVEQAIGGYDCAPAMAALRKYDQGQYESLFSSCGSLTSNMDAEMGRIDRAKAAKMSNPIVARNTNGIPQPLNVTTDALSYAYDVTSRVDDLRARGERYFERIKDRCTLGQEVGEGIHNFDPGLRGSELDKKVRDYFGLKAGGEDAFYDQMDNGATVKIRNALADIHERKSKKERTVFWLVSWIVILALFGIIAAVAMVVSTLIFNVYIPLIIGTGIFLYKSGDITAKFGLSQDIDGQFDIVMQYQLWQTMSGYRQALLDKSVEVMQTTVAKYKELNAKACASVDFLPEEYRDVDSVKRLKEIVVGGYADTLKEAYSAYETEKLRKKQQEEIETAERFRIAQAAAMTLLNDQVGRASALAQQAVGIAINAQAAASYASASASRAESDAATAAKISQENKAKVDKMKRDLSDLN